MAPDHAGIIFPHDHHPCVNATVALGAKQLTAEITLLLKVERVHSTQTHLAWTKKEVRLSPRLTEIWCDVRQMLPHNHVNEIYSLLTSRDVYKAGADPQASNDTCPLTPFSQAPSA